MAPVSSDPVSGASSARPAEPRRVGVREVARLAGVSTQTVSRVLNDRAGIRDDTRRRVREAMVALSYRPNNAARALGTSTSRTLGVIASDATLYGPSAGIAALESAVRAQGRWMATAYADAADAASVAAAGEHLLAQGVDGVIVVAAHALSLDAVAGLGVPAAALHVGTGAERQEEGARLVVEHLAGLGHRVIGCVDGPADWLEATARRSGSQAAFDRMGLAPGPAWPGDWTAAAGAALAPRIAAAVREGVTAVAVANDQMALGLVAGLRAEGFRVPDDVSVTGFDDTPESGFYDPALTTVRLDLAGEARRCVAEVLDVAAEAPGSPELVVRASTASPNPADGGRMSSPAGDRRLLPVTSSTPTPPRIDGDQR